MTQEEFKEMLIAAMNEMGYDDSATDTILDAVNDNVLMTGVYGSWNGAKFIPQNYVRVKMSALKSDMDYSSKTDEQKSELARTGTTRPTGLTEEMAGVQFFDKTLSPPRPIYWSGAEWVDATGNAV